MTGRTDWWIPLLPLLARRGLPRPDPDGDDPRGAAAPPASVFTIGFGGSMGLEGPSIYSGSAIGDWVEKGSM